MLDVQAASAAGVLIGHADKSFVASTAELALGLTIDLARNVSESTIDYRRGEQPAQQPGRQLRGQTAGIIGYGAIGSYLADLRSRPARAIPISTFTTISIPGRRARFFGLPTQPLRTIAASRANSTCAVGPIVTTPNPSPEVFREQLRQLPIAR